jgi:hypothetical protein
MMTHTPAHRQRRRRRPFLERRILGISARYWAIAGIVLGLCLSIYEVSHPVTPDAFNQPGAQIPNQLRSPWGVKNPL